MEGEWPEIYKEHYSKARKTHICCECQNTINNGETYQRSEGLWDGSFSLYKTCKPCYKLRNEVIVELDMHNIAFEYLYETIKDYGLTVIDNEGILCLE